MKEKSSKEDELSLYRQKIDDIDDKIYEFLCERAQCALDIGEIKKALLGKECSFYVPQREDEILQRLKNKKNCVFDSEALCAVYEKIIAVCRELQEKNR